MISRTKYNRISRVHSLIRILTKLYPHPKIALNYSNNWELLVAVMLSAQCTDIRVNATTKILFKKYRTIDAYQRATQTEIEKILFHCGLYRKKARNIRQAANMIIEKYGGDVPATMSQLLEIPGVARKTANVVLSNAFGIHDGIAVDTHVRRFAIRFNLSDFSDPIHIEKDLLQIVPKHEWWSFNHRLVCYGRDICPARKHDCRKHPLTVVYPRAIHTWPKAR